ncbi:hypothetical protein E8E13_006010 [Curvularia kusanoi]|uniref:Alcohol dehydrogenase n=1 Tax=Curvularia kusanoi TaxID=90978 RepID=A0A9P4T7A2_CURKU|nr:hypothetical protein E8E13_006010 [Curvularia kusanoi]
MPSAIAIKKIDGKPGQVYYPLEKITIPAPSPKDNEAVITLTAAALNHRDLFIRQHLYPGTTFGVPLLADGVGNVTSTGSSSNAKQWLNKRVILNPGTGWDSAPDGPEAPSGYAILGGTKTNPAGTLADHIGKIEKAVQLGAKGGAGGIISVYGMTISPKMDFLMSAVLRNIEVRGSTMGSRKEFADMVAFVREKKLKPVVSRSVHGLDIKQIDTLFDDMKNASQFGKLVVTLGEGKGSKL